MDALARLKEKGMMLAIVSNKMQVATEELRQHFFSQYIDVAIGESAAIRKKPAPDTVNEALRLLGISHDEAIYVGDSDVDIDTARAAMMPCASVLWGFRDRQFLLNHGATRLLSSPEELLSLV
jgi:phosphoglycolate phosphatase